MLLLIKNQDDKHELSKNWASYNYFKRPTAEVRLWAQAGTETRVAAVWRAPRSPWLPFQQASHLPPTPSSYLPDVPRWATPGECGRDCLPV